MSGQKNQDLNALYSHSQSALCYVPFLDFGDNKLEIICFCCKIKHDFPCVKHFLPGLHPLRKIHFLFSYYNLYFSFIYFLNFHFIPLRDWWRGFRGLLILWKLEVDWDWRISCACFRVSDEIRFFDKALTKAIVICSKMITLQMRKFQRFLNSHSVLYFLSLVMKLLKPWPSTGCTWRTYGREW